VKIYKKECLEQLAWKMMGCSGARRFRSQNVGLFYDFHEKFAFWKIWGKNTKTMEKHGHRNKKRRMCAAMRHAQE